ncbi:MAG: helix-turn-helix domain-containing protein [Novosphingobium sp.]|nr:helix-turn-helix domain-containing protein [Novosphingobium sp.]
MSQLEELQREVAHPLVDLSNVEQEQRELLWDNAVRTNFRGLSVKLTGRAPSSGLIRRMAMGAGQLFSILSAPAEVSFLPPRGEKAMEPLFSLMVQFKGSTLVSQLGQSCLLEEGDLCMIDEAKAFRLVSEEVTGVVIARLPRAAVLSRYPHFERLCASILPSSDCGTGFVGDLLLRLSRDADRLGEMQRGAMLNGIIHMLGVAGPVAQVPTLTHWRVQRALEYIELNLSVAGLTAETVAQDQRISRRRLDQLMHEAFGHSIASQLWSRRLEQAAADLRDPHRSNRSIAQIAFANGFEDAAHFTRAFKRRFSITPGQWRLN